VDVDGVISLWGFESDRLPAGTWHAVDGLPHFLSAAAGEHLLALAADFDLVWCTGWEDRANEHLPALLGLAGPLPFLTFGAPVEPGATTPGHWKLAAVDAYAGDRPAAWVDDALNEACDAWAAARPAPTHLERTDPATGLTDRGAERLRAFARSLRS
jgi:hypothetical protein